MKKSIYILALFATSTALASQSLNLEGAYECKGNEVGTNAAFKCQMVIKKTGKTYPSTANCSDGNAYRGIGIYDESSHLLSSGFINPKKSEETGVCITKVEADGSLSSEWTYLDNTMIGHTKCYKQNNKH